MQALKGCDQGLEDCTLDSMLAVRLDEELYLLLDRRVMNEISLWFPFDYPSPQEAHRRLHSRLCISSDGSCKRIKQYWKIIGRAFLLSCLRQLDLTIRQADPCMVNPLSCENHHGEGGDVDVKGRRIEFVWLIGNLQKNPWISWMLQCQALVLCRPLVIFMVLKACKLKS